MSAISHPARRLALAAAVIACLAPVASADTTFFSFQGTFSASTGATQDFFYTIPSIGGNDPMTLRTLAYTGGTNAAGQTILPGGIDSTLTLFNSVPTQVAFNDDVSPNVPVGNRDSSLSPTGTNTSLLAPQPGGSYDLRLANFQTNIGDGHWATDITSAAAGTNTTLTSSVGTNSSLSSLSFGATGFATATVSLAAAGSLTLNSSSTLAVGNNAALNVVGGTLNAGGNITASGPVTVNNGAFNWGAGKSLTINPTGRFDILNGNYSLPANAQITVGSGGARFRVASGANALLSVNNSSQIAVNGGLLSAESLSIGTNGTGTVTLTGGNLVAFGTTTTVGAANGNGTLNLNAASTATVTTLNIANDAVPSTGLVNVTAGSTLTAAGNISLSTQNTPGSSATLNINGPGSLLTQTAGGLSLSSVGSATINVGVTATGGTLTAGAAGTYLGPASSINLGSGSNAGTFNALNFVSISGGGTGTGLRVAANSAFNLPAGGQMLIQSAGQAVFAAGYSTPANTVYTVSGPGSKLTAVNSLRIGDNGGTGTAFSVSGGALVSANDLAIANGANATVTVDGPGSSASATGGLSYWALSGYTANVTFSNQATGSFPQGLALAQSQFQSVANVSVQSAAHLTVGNLDFCDLFADGTNGYPTATLTVTDPNSSVTLNPGAILTLGDGTPAVSTLNVLNNAHFTVGAGGSTNLNPGATININSGYADLKTLNYNGGAINFTAGSLSLLGNLTVGVGGPLGADLTLAPNRSLTLSGTTTVDPFHSLTLAGGSLSTGDLANNGSFNFSSGTLTLTGPAGLTIGAGGMLGSSFSLGAARTLAVTNTTTIAPTGILYLTGGTLTATAGLTNNGELQLLDPTSQLTGTTLTNNKLLDGNGRISTNLTNSPTGELRATGPTQRLTLAGPTNSNAGKINLVNGGTIEFTTPLTNSATGVITGRGALITASIANAGQIQLSAGLTDVYGPVTTSAGGKIIVTGLATATFYNAIAMNAGSEFRVTAGSTAVFFSPVTGLGQFTGTGTKFFEAGASAPGFLATGGATVVDVPASLTVDYFRESSLSISGLAFTRPGSPASVVNTLSIDPAASLDLADNKLILDYTGPSQANAIRLYLLNHNLLSSTANADPLHRLAIGYLDNTLLGAPAWGGLAVDPTSVLTKLTYLGDANLDGRINADDYALLDKGFAQHASTWAFGDFNYDGTVTAADYLLIDRVFTQQTGVLSPTLLAQRESQFGADYVTALIASVPEPTSLLACGFAVPTLLRRRHAKRFTR